MAYSDDTTMAKAFISYSTDDQEKADRLRSWFLEDRIPVWMAPYDIPAGADWSDTIEDAIRDCGCFVLLLSESSLASKMVKRELQRAAHYDKTIFPVKLEPVDVSAGFAFYIGIAQFVLLADFRKDSEDVRQLTESIHDHLTAKKSKSKPETKPEAKPETKPETRPEPKPETSDPEFLRALDAEARVLIDRIPEELQKELRNAECSSSFRRHFSIPQDTVGYLMHDGTRFHNGRSGFAVLPKGVVCRMPDAEAEYLSWQEFLDGTMENGDTANILRLPSTKEKRTLFCYTGTTENKKQISRFFRDLQTWMRDTCKKNG